MLMRTIFRAVQDWRLRRLIEKARGINVSPEDREAQRRNFAYHNLKLDHPEAKREDLDHAAEMLIKERRA